MFIWTYESDAPEPDPKPGIAIKHKVQTRPGYTAALMMISLGNPHPTFTWTHNGAMVAHKEYYGGFSMVTIHGVKIKDFGNYTLMVNNSVGTYVAHYVIEPYGNVLTVLWLCNHCEG